MSRGQLRGPDRRRAEGARGRPWSESGAATVEAAFLIALLVIPLFYLVGTLGRLQAGAYAVSAAVREAGRLFVTAEDPATGQGRAHAGARLVLQSHAFDPGEGTVVLSCSGRCLEPGSTVVVRGEVRVPLPLVPDFVRGAVPAHITLAAHHVEPVDEFRAARGQP